MPPRFPVAQAHRFHFHILQHMRLRTDVKGSGLIFER